MGEATSLTGGSIGGTHGVLEYTQIHLPGNRHQMGMIRFWEAGEVTKSGMRAEQTALFLL